MDVRNLLKITDMYVKVDWKNYFGEDASESIKKYISDNKETIFPWLYDTIKFSIKHELKEVAILRFQEDKLYATIQSKDFPLFCEKLIEYYVSTEEYEICAEIRDLIADLKVKELLAVKPKRKRAKKQTEPVLVTTQK
jgi:hypothetical protein